jgi:hypothetical protein
MCLVTELVWVISEYNVAIEGTVYKEEPEQIELALLKHIASNAVSSAKF